MGNNPVNYIDPLGLWTASTGTVISGAGFGFGGGVIHSSILVTILMLVYSLAGHFQ